LASVCCWGTNSVVPSPRSTGMMDLLYDGTVPTRNSCGSSPERYAWWRSGPDSRAARPARAWCPRCCASAMACDSVIAWDESEGAVWAASPAVTNAPKRASVRHTRLFMRSLVAEADDWILSRGAVGGNDPKRDPHGERHAEGDEDGQG